MKPEFDEDKALSEWLNSFEDKYKDNCRLAFGKFMEFLREKCGWREVSGDLILSRHEANRKSDDKRVKYYFDDLVPSYVAWYEAKGVSHNYVIVQIAMVRSFFKFHREPLVVQKRIKSIEVKKQYHTFTKDELVKMVQVGDLDEKALIMLGVQLGIRVGDFVSLQRKPILEAYLNSNGIFPLQFEIETEKEGVLSICHISKDVYEMLKIYWAQAPKSEYAFPSNNGRVFISEDRANDMIKNTWRKAYPERKDVKVRFHELRSYKISTLANFGVNEWIIKKMTGKKISSDMNGYLTGINLKEAFTKALEALTLTQVSDRNYEAMEKLKKEIDLKVEEQVDERIRVLQRLIDRYANENMDLKDRLGKTEKGLSELREIFQQFLERNIFNVKGFSNS